MAQKFVFNPFTSTLDVVDIASTTNSFETIQTDTGTSPVAENSTDTLTLTSSDSSIDINGNSTTDTVDFTLASTFADTDLSNLVAPTFINANLEPDTDNSRNIGSFAGKDWFRVLSGQFQSSVEGREIVMETLLTTSATTSGRLRMRTGSGSISATGGSGEVILSSGDQLNGAASTNTGRILINTGAVSGSGDSGEIEIRPGTVNTGTRGKIKLVDGSEGTTGHVWTSTDTAGNGNWAALPAGGETNTASNVGVGGVGVFKQKTGVDLEFKNINAGSSKITVTNDAANNEVDIDVTEVNINHDNLSGFVAGEHTDAQVKVSSNDTIPGYLEDKIVSADTKITVTTINDGADEDVQLTLNEGNLTLDNIGGTLSISKGGTGQTTQTSAFDALAPTTTKGDVVAHNGTDNIRLAVGTNGQVLTVDSAETSGIKWANLPADVDMAVAQARRTTVVTIDGTLTDVTFDVTDIENDTSIVEHDNTNTDRIILKETGPYLISYNVNVDSPTSVGNNMIIQALVRVNDTTNIAGSESESAVFSDASVEGDDHDDNVQNSFIYNATANDFISLQLARTLLGTSTGTVDTKTQITLSAVRLKGTKGADGAQGPAGSGSTITVKEEGSNITGTPHSSLNFIGSNITATDAGAGQANITVTGGLFGSEYQTVESDGTSTTTSSTFVQKVRLTTTSLPLGTYFLIFMMEMETPSGSIQVRIEQNDTTTLGQGGTDGSLAGIFQHISGHKILTSLSGIHTFDLDFRVASGSPTVSVRRARITLWRIN